MEVAVAVNIEIRYTGKTDRSDPHARIQNVGGMNPDGTKWQLTVLDAIAGMETGRWNFYTLGGGKSVRVVLATHNGYKYLKTEADGVHPDHLLALPDCP
jgi:Protein of unknown function (DUF3892)